MDFELSDASHRTDSLRFICIFMGGSVGEIDENMLQFGFGGASRNDVIRLYLQNFGGEMS